MWNRSARSIAASAALVLRRYSSTLIVAAVIGTLASLGGSWGVALGQTAPAPTAAPAPSQPAPAFVFPTSAPPPPTLAPQPTAAPSAPITPGMTGLTIPVPTLAPTIVPIVPAVPPAGMPTVTAGGVIAVIPAGAIGPTGAGVGVVKTQFEGRTIEARVPLQDATQSLAVRLQPLSTPPTAVSLPPGDSVVKLFSLDVFKYDAGSNSIQPRTEDEKTRSASVVLTWPLTQQEYGATADDSGNARPERLTFYQFHESPPNPPQLLKVQTTWQGPPPGTLTGVFKDYSVFILAVVPLQQVGRTVPNDPRYFRQTGFRVDRDSFWDYFNRRGGVATFGYPISREFTLLGFRVQFFQRSVLQAMPDGSVARMNLLEQGIMPYSRMNFSTLPAPDPELIVAAPLQTDPNYAEKALAFVRANAPDQWNGMQVNFLSTFLSTVSYEDAFPDGKGEPGLLPLMDLEIWGLPISKPTKDPNNGNFVYQRFQRGILHYDASNGMTQGLLLVDYLKSIITGRNLPLDLELQARTSRFYRQYSPTARDNVARPADLPGTNLQGAFDTDVPQETAGSVASTMGIGPLLAGAPLAGLVLALGARPGRRRNRD